MAAWLHGVCVGECFFVFPLCGFSLSLFGNYMIGCRSPPCKACLHHLQQILHCLFEGLCGRCGVAHPCRCVTRIVCVETQTFAGESYPPDQNCISLRRSIVSTCYQQHQATVWLLSFTLLLLHHTIPYQVTLHAQCQWNQ